MNLKNVDLLGLQTRHMQSDSTTKAMCAALTPRLRQVAEAVEGCLILSRVDVLTDGMLDWLAQELHVEWYDVSATVEVKRELIRNSDKVHMTMGTPYAIEQVVQDYFGDGRVEEWFEYNGEPFHFRVVTSNPAVTTDMADRFQKAIETVKRKSTRLEQVIVEMAAELPVYFGNVLHIGDVYTVEQVV